MNFLNDFIFTDNNEKIVYHKFPWNKNHPIIIFSHWLFWNWLMFNRIIDFLKILDVECISIDLRWFWESSKTNVRIDTIIKDIKQILEREKIIINDNSKYSLKRPIILVWYSMWTIINSILKQELNLKEKDNKKISLFHISPILRIRKRNLLRHLFIKWINESDIDIWILVKPKDFFLLLLDIFKNKKYIDLSWYMLSWMKDFCYYSWNKIENLKIIRTSDHYLMQRNPVIIRKYLMRMIRSKINNDLK